jgi:hypothetical protein
MSACLIRLKDGLAYKSNLERGSNGKPTNIAPALRIQ